MYLTSFVNKNTGNEEMWNWGKAGGVPRLRTSPSPRRSCQGPPWDVETPNCYFLVLNLGTQKILVTGITEWHRVGCELGVCSSGWEGGMCSGGCSGVSGDEKEDERSSSWVDDLVFH